MSLLKARKDWKRYTSSGGFEDELIFESPAPVQNATIKGLATKHHQSFDPDGQSVNSLNVHITFSESLLIEAGYTTRVNNEVSLTGHKVSYKDSAGFTKQYRVQQQFQDETVGVITCILEESE